MIAGRTAKHLRRLAVLCFCLWVATAIAIFRGENNKTITQADTEIRELAQHNRDLCDEIEDLYNTIPQCPHCSAMLFRGDNGTIADPQWEAWFRVDAGKLQKLGEVETHED